MTDEDMDVSVGKPNIPEYLKPAYANNINVNHTPHDFRITFSLLTVPLEVSQDGPDELTIRPQAVADIVIPASVMHALLGVLRFPWQHSLGLSARFALCSDARP